MLWEISNIILASQYCTVQRVWKLFIVRLVSSPTPEDGGSVSQPHIYPDILYNVKRNYSMSIIVHVMEYMQTSINPLICWCVTSEKSLVFFL